MRTKIALILGGGLISLVAYVGVMFHGGMFHGRTEVEQPVVSDIERFEQAK